MQEIRKRDHQIAYVRHIDRDAVFADLFAGLADFSAE